MSRKHTSVCLCVVLQHEVCMNASPLSHVSVLICPSHLSLSLSACCDLKVSQALGKVTLSYFIYKYKHAMKPKA